ncbi:hypothetical protein [Streptomyces sp. NPDC093109]|uniref:hypothetical protein n=1 Tax=Streptomyces sp. NPDC093109 TaxID=3154977 RepID=UPI00344E04C9
MSKDEAETRGGERHELMAKDTNRDGKADVWFLDTDGDGKPDVLQFDTDGDGEVDVTIVDVDEDGNTATVQGDGGYPANKG